MASKHRANGSRPRRRPAKDFIGEEPEDANYFDFAVGNEEISWDFPVPSFSFQIASVIVFFVSIICYWNSCNAGFVFDDSEAIVGNKDMKAEVPLGKLFLHDFWGANISSNVSHKSYRPLTILTFRFNYWLSGGLRPWGFHFINVILHAVVSVLSLKLYSVLISARNTNRTFNDNDNNGKSTRIHFSAPKPSLVCALIFAVHPIHTESVAGLVGRADLLSALFFILSFLFYARCCVVDREGRSPEHFSWTYLAMSMFFCSVAMLCKEQGITVLGICCIYDIIVVCEVDPFMLIMKAASSREDRNGPIYLKEKKGASLWQKGLIYRQLALLVTGVILLLYRWWVMGSSAPVFQVVDNPASFEKSLVMRVINYNYIYAINAWLLLVPQWLCFDWSMGCVPLIKTYTDPRILCIGALWTVLLLLLMYCICGKNLQMKRILTMGFAILVVPFLPASNIFFTVGFVVAERVLYLSSIGSCLITVLGFTLLSKKNFGKTVLGFAVGTLMALYMARIVQRSAEWFDEDTLFSSGLSVCPLNAKVHYNIGKMRAEKGQVEIAEKFYREAIRLNPRYDQALNNLGNLIKDDGRYEEAEALLEKAVEIRNNFAAGWMNLGTVKAALHKVDEAEKCYSNAINYRPRYPDAFFNLGNLYIDQDKTAQAIAAFKTAINLKNDHVGAWMNHALLLEKSGNRDAAITVIREAKTHIPNEPSVHFNLANMLGQKDEFLGGLGVKKMDPRAGLFSLSVVDLYQNVAPWRQLFNLTEEAEKHFLIALKLKPNSAEIYGNLGVLYHRWGKHQQADKYYKKALKLDPQSENVYENLQKLKRTTRKLSNGRLKVK